MASRPLVTKLALTAVWLGIILVGGIAVWGTRPPPAVDAAASPNVFSAARAVTHLAQIAKNPRPIGSSEAERVREYLVGQLTALGGEVHVEQGLGTVQFGRNLHSGLVNNIVATFPGKSSGRPIMLVAHYDSVPEGPGAADDGAGLIVILEAIRALRAGPPIKNDLIVLFSDGEEAHGLLGAQAFVKTHPDLADRIGMMVNLEARGSSGPGLMFETSDDNGALIREFARAAPYPMATSLMAAVYQLLPNDTDFTPLKAAGVTGLNFAFLETYQNYHTRLDAIENLDQRSVHHLGANVLGVIQHFGNLAQPEAKKRDVVYFNWFASKMWVYPKWLAWVIALLAPIFFAFFCLRWKRRLELTVARTALGFGTFFLQLLVTVGGSFAAFAAARIIAGEFLDGDTFSNQLLFAGMMGIGFALAIALQRLLRNKLGLANFAAGQLFAVACLALLVCWFLIGGSYVLQWPLLFGMAGMLLSFRVTEPSRSFFQFAFLIPALLVLVPLAYLFFVALTFTYIALAAAALLLTTLIAMSPALFDRLAGRCRLSLLIIFLLSASLIGAGIHLSVRSSVHPRRDSLIYSVNTDENKARWVSYDATPDSWTAHVLGSAPRKQKEPAYTAGVERPVLTSDATLVPLESPFFAITQNFVSDGAQTITLKIASRRDARSFVVRLPGDLKLSSAGWNGEIQPIDATSHSSAPWTFRFYNAPPEGVSLEFRFAAHSGSRAWIADATPGLPTIVPLSPRPDDTTPEPGSDITLVARALDF